MSVREKQLESALTSLLDDFAFLKERYNEIANEIRKVTDGIKCLPVEGDTSSMSKAKKALRPTAEQESVHDKGSA